MWDGDSLQTAESEAGTKAHRALECLLRGEEVPKDIDIDLVDRAEWAHKELLRIAGEAPIMSEAKVVFDIDKDHRGITGRCDAFFINDGAWVADFKTFDMGEKDYTAQLCGYGIAICQGTRCLTEKPVHLVTLSAGARRATVRTMGYDEMVERVRRVIQRREDVNSTPCPSSGCKYCRYARMCKGPDLAIATVQDKPAWSSLSLPEQFVVVKGLKGIIANFEKSAKAAIAKQGGSITGGGLTLSLREKSGRMEFNDLPAIAKVLRDKAGISPQDFIKLCSVSKTTLVDALRPKGEDGKYLRTEKEAVDIIKEVATYGKPSYEMCVA